MGFDNPDSTRVPMSEPLEPQINTNGHRWFQPRQGGPIVARGASPWYGVVDAAGAAVEGKRQEVVTIGAKSQVGIRGE